MSRFPMLSAFVLVACGLSLAGACRRNADQEPTTPEESSDQGDGVAGEPAPATGQVEVTAELRPGDQVAITVANGTDGRIELVRALSIEQLDGDEWVELEAVGEVWVRTACSPVDGVLYPEGQGHQCFELPARTQLEVSPWLGTFGDAQCACEQCERVPAGRYRIVAHGCEGQRFESNPVAIRLREDDEDAAEPLPEEE